VRRKALRRSPFTFGFFPDFRSRSTVSRCCDRFRHSVLAGVGVQCDRVYLLGQPPSKRQDSRPSTSYWRRGTDRLGSVRTLHRGNRTSFCPKPRVAVSAFESPVPLTSKWNEGHCRRRERKSGRGVVVENRRRHPSDSTLPRFRNRQLVVATVPSFASMGNHVLLRPSLARRRSTIPFESGQ